MSPLRCAADVLGAWGAFAIGVVVGILIATAWFLALAFGGRS